MQFLLIFCFHCRMLFKILFVIILHFLKSDYKQKFLCDTCDCFHKNICFCTIKTIIFIKIITVYYKKLLKYVLQFRRFCNIFYKVIQKIFILFVFVNNYLQGFGKKIFVEIFDEYHSFKTSGVIGKFLMYLFHISIFLSF